MIASGACHPDDQNSAYESEALLDAPLTDLGKQQAAALVSSAANIKPDLVMVSSQTRTLQTAHIMFRDQKPPPGGLLVTDGMREGMNWGRHPCNRRRRTAEIKRHFEVEEDGAAGFDWAAVTSEEDTVWVPLETDQDLAGRVKQWLEVLDGRTESNVVVVAHCCFFWSLLNDVVVCDEGCNVDWFEPGELRTFYFSNLD